MSIDAKPAHIVQAPLFPTYSHLAFAIRALAGETVQRVRNTISTILDQTGTPQDPVNWTDPDTWIKERLSGEQQKLAQKIWQSSGKTLNPRYLYGCYLFINREKLLNQTNGAYGLSDRGKRFLAGDEAILRELDAAEGLPKLLTLVAERSPCKRAAILPAWSDYLKAVSVFTTPKTFADTLRRRLVNLAERGLLTREGNSNAISASGLAWLKGFTESTPGAGGAPTTKHATVIEAAQDHNEEQLAAFKAMLMALEPFQFEHFVKELLDAMDYEDVRVTKISGDKGVDVVARVQFGITEITEVVQVKRTETTIHRPIIDQLRGALPYHGAIRGTIITLGSFAKNAQEFALYVGAAPITLIDGKRLLEMCVKHEVGLKRRQVEIYEIDDAFFIQKFGRAEDDGTAEISEAEMATANES